jgi:hypothetical protein
MTDIIEDNVDVDLQIGTEGPGFSSGNTEPGVSNFNEDALFWDVIEMKVEITQVAVPNYVKGKVTPRPETLDDLAELLDPDPGETDAPDEPVSPGSLPNNGISRLVGSRFRLEANNDLVAIPSDDEEAVPRGVTDEVSPEEEDNLLFDGRLANISPIGTNQYEVIAYDPGQQAFNIGGESGSVINQKLELTGSSVTGIRDPGDAKDNNVTGEHEIPASELVQFIIDEAGIGSKSVVQLSTPGARTDRTLSQAEQAGSEILISFKKSVVPVKEALNKVREQTRSEWWFDKDGTFYFGDPATLGEGVQTYEVSLIKDTSAGIVTPPYQSVRVIGSGVATTEGWAGNVQIQDEVSKIVQEVNVGLPQSSGSQSELVLELDPDRLFEPTFKYINAELSTAESVQNTALKIADELIKQQASGKVTLVGFPEIQPFDGLLMPNTEEQPMGGQLYDVYAVRHKLNASDGFVTEIEVAGPNPALRGKIDVGEEGERNIIPTSIDRDVYTPDGEKRAFAPGAGKGGGLDRVSGSDDLTDVR